MSGRRVSGLLVLGLTCNTCAAQDYKPGDLVVVIADAKLHVPDNTAVIDFKPGLVLKVEAVNGKWLWVSYDRPGWLDHHHVIPLDRRAIQRLTSMIESEPRNAELYSGRAEVWEHLGELDKAIADHNEAVRLDPSSSGCYNDRGNAWRAKGEYDKAIADYDKAQRIDPNDPAIYSNRGLAWDAKGEHDKAINEYNEALRIDPKLVAAYCNRSLAWHAKGEYDKAIADCNHSLRLDPKDANSFNNRGHTWHAKGEYDKAIADYNQALALDREFAWAYNNRGLTWRAKGEYDKAIADYNEALRLDQEYVFAYHNRGTAWQAKGEYDKAIADYNHSLRLDPKYAYALYERAVVEMLTRRSAVANSFQDVLNLQGWKGDLSTYAVILGHFAGRQQRDQAAAKRFLDESAGKLSDSWPYPVVQFLRGEIDEDALRKLATDKDKETDVGCFLGIEHALRGRRDEALQCFRLVKQKGSRSLIEYDIALAELKRLEESAK